MSLTMRQSQADCLSRFVLFPCCARARIAPGNRLAQLERQAENMSIAAIYHRGDVLLVHANVRTKDGFRIAYPPYQRVTLAPRVMAEAIAVALGVPEPVATPDRSAYPRLATEYYASADARNHTQFMKGARYFEVSTSEDGFIITPKINGGAKGQSKGFSTDDKRIERFPPKISMDEIASRIIELIKNEK